ncbi:MAG: cytochrome c [Proteobacteria bacterium]|nr:cytochrome c [Pseudomonadota bacterium]MDA1331875.1 cytochrome c [Pseudomonadota bacterium]
MSRFVLYVLVFYSVNFSVAIAGDVEAGKARYSQNCFVCHGPSGKGLSSYPKLAGKDIAYLVDRLKRYRSEERFGPNSDLMIINAIPLSDDEIANLAAYLNSAKVQ